MKALRKILAIVMALALVFSLAACSGGSGDEENTTAAPVGTTPIAKDKIKVGVLHITSIKDTSGYTYAHHQGIVAMKTALGLKDEQVIEKDEIPDSDAPAVKAALDELVNAGCNIIFGTSFNYMDPMDEYAKKYPDVIFSHGTGYKSNDVNFNNYFGRIYQARYLSGIAAGMKAKEMKNPNLGYVAAMDVTNSEVTGGINAFALGVQSVYPEAVVKVSVTGSWADEKAEATAAKALVDAGCGVLAQHCDSSVPQTTAADNKIFGCGYNSDMTAQAPTAHICAPIWHWDVYYTTAVKQVIDGKWTPANYFGGLNEGFIDVSPINEAVAAKGTKEAVDAAKAKIMNGELVVFAKGMTKADGTVIDHDLTDAEITGEINYYIKGVELLK